MRGIFRRIGRFIRMLLSLVFEGLEETIPLERRLAHDRQEKAEVLEGMLDKSEDAGAQARLLSGSLAEARIIVTNLNEEAEDHLQSAKAAVARGDMATEQSEHAAAAALADDLAEREAWVRELEAIVAEAFQDDVEVRQMVLDTSLQLERLADKDALLISQQKTAEVRMAMTKLREDVLELIPEARDDIRQTARRRVREMRARADSRKETVDALWEQKQRRRIDRRTQVSIRGSQILERLQTKVGYQPTKAMPAPAEVTDEEVRRKVAAARE